MATAALCDALAKVNLSTRLFTPDQDEYNESVGSYWSNQASEVKPACVISPHTPAEVSLLVKILTDTNLANGFSTPYAIRSGGHQTWAGAASIEGGVTVDLRALRTLNIDKPKNVVTVGTGYYWGELYDALAKQELTLPGARVPNCGVTGLCLGGGISYFSPKEGMVCDNVLDFEIVLADGTVTHANAATNADLWRALKGGANNFGVVTALTMGTFEQKQLWGGTIAADLQYVPSNIDAFASIAGGANYDPNAAYLTAAGFHHQWGSHAYSSLKYTLPKPDAPVFKPFTDVPALRSTMRVGTLNEMIKEEGALQVQGFRRIFITTSFIIDAALMKKGFELWQSALPKVKSVKGAIFTITYNPVLPAAVARGRERGGNCLGLDGLEKPLVVAMVPATWEDAADDPTVVDAAKEVLAGIDAEARARGLYHPYKYMNYGWEGQDVIAGYGERSVAMLCEVSRKYDPHQVFQKAVPGGFKLP